jgi:uncharacterized protein (DUF58 family)
MAYSEKMAGKFEAAVGLAAGLSSHFIQEGAEVEFAVPENVVLLQSGEQHLHRILGVLALIEPLWDCSEKEFIWPASVAESTIGGAGIPPERQYKILLTSRPRGSIPSSIWRTSRVEYIAEL